MTLPRMLLFVSVSFIVCSTLVAQNNPVKVTFADAKLEEANFLPPVDTQQRIAVQNTGGMTYGLVVDGNKWLTCGAGAIWTTFKIDEQIMSPQDFGGGIMLRGGVMIQGNIGGPVQFLPGNGPVAAGGIKTSSAKKAPPLVTESWRMGNLQFTETIELVPGETPPGKAAPAKRPLDTVLVKFTIENKDTRAHKVGTRVRIDTQCGANDGALFAAPTMPGTVLDGVELKDKTLPDYVQILERPDLNNPGFVGHFTLKVGTKMIGPDRFLCTSNGADRDEWNLNVIRAGGDSACAIYWEPREIPAGEQVVMAYGYGASLATLPENEGSVRLALGGSFEPGKTFTVTAYVEEPVESQTLTLHMPEGMRLVEGREIQPVPATPPNSGTSVVMWKGRVDRVGDFPIRVVSSNGVTQTRTVSISRSDD